ncbi:MAG: phosphatidate cytidylyltransferase [Bacteroidia bacterium]|nr:phosphatidate cytidylyltransferase [Bacteroidia bacterium]
MAITYSADCTVLRRTLTALIAGGLLVAWLHFFGITGFFVAWILIGLLLIHEWVRGEKLPLFSRAVLTLLTVCIWGAAFWAWALKAAVIGFLLSALWGLRRKSPELAWRWLLLNLHAILIIGVGWGAIGWILHKPYSLERTLAFLSMTWVADIMAYIGGRWLGRRPILPQISPQKTVEGLIFSVIGTALWGRWAMQWVGNIEGIPPEIVGGIVALTAFIGDAYQSAWKRLHHLKDSGRLLPGHGGIWDRVDSLIWVAGAWYFLS